MRHELDLFSTFHPQVQPEREFVLMPGTIQEVELVFEPSVPGKISYMVHVVDTKNRTVIERWMVNTTAVLPVVSKTYDIPVHSTNNPVIKTIAFTNPYSTDKEFKIKTNTPSLVSFRTTQLSIASHQSENIVLTLSPVAVSVPNYILIFVTDVEQKCEECFAIRVTAS